MVFLGDARVIEVVVYWVHLHMEVRVTVLIWVPPGVISSGLQVNVVVVIDVFCCDYDLTGKDETSKKRFLFQFLLSSSFLVATVS